MASRLANKATNTFVAALERAIAGFAEHRRLIRLPFDPSIGGDGLTPPQGDPIPLYNASGDVHLALALTIRYRVVEEPERRNARVAVIAYSYQLEVPSDPPLDLLRYEWHPYIPDMTWPHVHVGEEVIGEGTVINERVHIRTGGFITLKDVLEHAMRDFRIVPCRRDWQHRLDAAHDALQAALSWADSRPPLTSTHP